MLPMPLPARILPLPPPLLLLEVDMLPGFATCTYQGQPITRQVDFQKLLVEVAPMVCSLEVPGLTEARKFSAALQRCALPGASIPDPLSILAKGQDSWHQTLRSLQFLIVDNQMDLLSVDALNRASSTVLGFKPGQVPEFVLSNLACV